MTHRARASRRLAFALLASLAVASCMLPPYKQPGSGPTAELTIARAEGSTAGRLFPSLSEVVSAGPGCKGMSALERIDNDSTESRVTTIVAHRPTHILLDEYDKNTGTRCGVAVDFDPVEGGRYKAVWSTVGNKCFIRLGRLTMTGGREIIEPEPSVRAARKYC